VAKYPGNILIPFPWFKNIAHGEIFSGAWFKAGWFYYPKRFLELNLGVKWSG
jgi:hypothetical protein